MVKKINFKRMISYLLIFALLFTTVQIGGIKKASATEVTQTTGLKIRVGSITGDELVVDKTATGGYVLDYLPTGKNFVLEPESGYTITKVASSNGTKMNIKPTYATSETYYTISSITDYSDFTLTVSMTDTNGDPLIYKIKMKFESDSTLEFNTLEVTYDDNTVDSIPYTSTDENGYYNTSTDSDVSTATIQILDSNDTEMTCKVNGSSSNKVTLASGDNTITITVTNQGISRDYILIITKPGVAKLKSLVPSAGTLSPTFSSDTYDYEITVAATQTTIAFTPTSEDNDSTIKVDGTTVTSGKKSQSIDLDEGENEISIVVKTSEGETSTYNITVTRTETATSAQLSALKLSKGTLSPSFNKALYEYTATVDNSVTSITVTPTAVDSTATIEVEGDEVPSGVSSSNISLDEGTNVINVKVTDTKGNSKTYVLTITRKYPKTNADLSSLSVTDGTLSPVFDPDTYLYSVKVARSVEKVRIKFTGQNDKIKIKIGDNEYTSGQQSDYINLDLGANLVQVIVTAEDGKTKVTYTLSIIRGDIEGKNDWVLVAGEWTFYDASGTKIKNQWVKYDNQWYFLDVNGYRQTGWLQESGKWYYLNSDGIMQTGWVYDKGYWYYLQGDGAMVVNIWATFDGKWYYFNNYGEMQTGWLLYSGKWYYMDEHGVVQKGWITYDKNKYYMNDDGTMKKGWFYSGKVWYYLDDSGQMVRGWKTIDGKNYYFDANGVMKTGMMFLDGQWINLNNA